MVLVTETFTYYYFVLWVKFMMSSASSYFVIVFILRILKSNLDVRLVRKDVGEVHVVGDPVNRQAADAVAANTRADDGLVRRAVGVRSGDGKV